MNLLFSILTVTLVSVCSLTANAESASPQGKSYTTQMTGYSKNSISKIRIGEADYNKAQIIWDFSNIALDSTLWLENTEAPWLSVKSQLQLRQLESEKGDDKHWWQKYSYFPQGLPERGVVNKWEDVVTIGINWPPELKDKSEDEIFDDSIKLIELQIQKLIPELEKATNLKISYLSPNDERRSGGYANLRIIPISATNLKNRFKTMYFRSNYLSEDYIYNVQAGFLSAVAFSPFLRSSVDGYFIPTSEHKIDFAACKIIASRKNPFLGSLISECLLRSLGLPNVSKLQSESLLKNWNSASDQDSLIPSQEGEAAIWLPPVTSAQIKKRNDFYEFASEPEGAAEANLKERFNPYDIYMLRLLYCVDVKKGEGREALINSLSRSQTCFN